MDHRGPIVNTTVVHYYLDMTREDPQMKLRLPTELKDVLTAAALKNNRSLNAEVVKRLEESVEGTGQGGPAQIDGHTFDLFADTVAGKVVRALDEREKRRGKR